VDNSLSFTHIEDKPKTKIWSCRNNKSREQLGVIKWYGPWRSYCFFPTTPAIYSAGCLSDIADFIVKVTPAR